MKENGLSWVYLKLELLLGAQNWWLFGSIVEDFGSSLKLGNFGLKAVDIPLPKPGISLQLSYDCAPQKPNWRKKKQEEGSLPANTIVL